MTGIKIPIQAAFDKGNVDQVLQDFQRQLNKLGQSVAQANKVKFTPVDKTSIEDLRRVTASFENLRRVSGDLNKRIRSTGQQGAGFFDLDWSKMYPDANSRARQMHKAYSYVVGNQFSALPAAPGGGGSGGGRPGGGGGGASPWAQAGRNVVGSGLNAMGPAGGVVNGAISSGMSGGVSAGLAGLAGGIAALALGKVIGAVMEKVGTAQNEAIGYDTLKRTLGDVNVSFRTLKESLRESARSLDMTFDESQRLGIQFAKLSGMTAEQYKTLAQEVSIGGGFGRSYGMDPSQSNAFFAQMRQFKVTTNSRESRELALMIGESVAKAGVPAKMEEVLEAIAGFTSQQTRMGMNVANVGGYSEMLTGLMGAGRAGLDPASSAALLARVNASIAGGGSAGEAGQNFLYSAIGSRLGLNPIQAKIMQEQGAFGTGRGAFGPDSMYAAYSGKHLIAGSSDVTNLQMIKERLDQLYKGRDDLKADAMANLFGVNISQAMALSSISGTRLGGLSARLKRNGININDVNATGISRISQIEANGSLSESEKDKQIKDAARQNQEETEGSKTRATINGVERATVDMASKLLEPLNAIRSGIMYMAGEGGKKSPRQIMEAVLTSESEDRISQLNSDHTNERTAANNKYLGALNARTKYQRDSHMGMAGSLTAGLTPEAYQRQMKILLDAERAAKEEKDRADLGAQYVEAIKGEKKRLADNIAQLRSGMTLGEASAGGSLFDQLLQQESGGRHLDKDGNVITSKKGARGIAQLMPDTARNPGFGISPVKDDSEDENRRVGREYFNAMMRRYGGDRQKALAAYNGGFAKVDKAIADGGSNWLSLMPAETRNYVPSILSKIDGNPYGTPMPEGVSASAGSGGSQDVRVSGEVTVNTSDGKSVAVPLNVTSRVNRPNPSGVRP